MYENEKNEVAKAFVKNGWEGDGTIMLMWLPPFIDYKKEDTYGSYIWHVKQSNNGTSFLAFVNGIPTDMFRNLYHITFVNYY